jgi:superfamily II RNA helicase
MADERSIISPDRLFLTTEIQQGVLNRVDDMYSRYLEVMSHSSIPIPDWLSKEDFTLDFICRGLGYPDMKFSDIINQSMVKGGLEVAKFLNELEKEHGIT